MFATNLTIELPIDASITNAIEAIYHATTIGNEKYQQIYDFIKASVESAIILNIVEESIDDSFDDIFILKERFLSDTLESTQQFQNSSDFQELFVQLFQSHGATVFISTENYVTLDSEHNNATMYELVNISVPNLMWETQFPYSD